jgi:hypothetical protein
MITLLIVIALVGFLVWALITYVPMHDGFKKAIIVIAILALILYVLRVFGISDIPVR